MFDNLKNSSLSEVPKKKLFSIGKLERGRRDEFRRPVVRMQRSNSSSKKKEFQSLGKFLLIMT